MSSREIPAEVMDRAMVAAKEVYCPSCADSIQDIADVIARALMEQQARWIPVEEGLPEEEGHYLIAVGGDVREAWFDEDDDSFCEPEQRACSFNATHWQPLPPVPTTDE